MDILIKVIQLFLCFTLLVGIHELGHFLMARVFGIRVDRVLHLLRSCGFSLFKFTPRTARSTVVGWLPLGGYCKIAGMVDESMDTEALEERTPQPWEFRSKPAWQRFLVMIVAGVVMNVAAGRGPSTCGVCYTWGDSYFAERGRRLGLHLQRRRATGARLPRTGTGWCAIDGEAVDEPDERSIAMTLLLTEGDRTRGRGARRRARCELTRSRFARTRSPCASSKGYEETARCQRTPFLHRQRRLAPTALDAGLRARRRGGRPGEPAHGGPLRIRRSTSRLLSRPASPCRRHSAADRRARRFGTAVNLPVPVSAEGTIGVIVQNPYTLRTQTYTFWESIPAGFRKAGDMISSYWEQLKMIVQPKTKMYEELGGFIAIGSIFPSSWDWQDFWLKTAFLSIILAVMNILPIPGLDGGHAIFTFWEMVTGRKVSDKVLEGAQYVGLIIILFLLLYANGNDIYRFFIK